MGLGQKLGIFQCQSINLRGPWQPLESLARHNDKNQLLSLWFNIFAVKVWTSVVSAGRDVVARIQPKRIGKEEKVPGHRQKARKTDRQETKLPVWKVIQADSIIDWYLMRIYAIRPVLIGFSWRVIAIVIVLTSCCHGHQLVIEFVIEQGTLISSTVPFKYRPTSI